MTCESLAAIARSAKQLVHPCMAMHRLVFVLLLLAQGVSLRLGWRSSTTTATSSPTTTLGPIKMPESSPDLFWDLHRVASVSSLWPPVLAAKLFSRRLFPGQCGQWIRSRASSTSMYQCAG